MFDLISVIIPVHNEEQYLPQCLQQIKLAADRISCPVEIIVVINRCTDSTEQIARDNNCKIVYSEAKNLSIIRNTGLNAAKGDIYVTIDADSLMSENMLLKITECLSNEKYIGGGVLILPDRWSLGIFCSLLALLPFFLFWRISAGLFFARSSAVKAIGGFDESKFSAEDIDFAQRLKSYGKGNGQKFKNLFSAHIKTSTRKFDRFGDWYPFRHPIMMLRLLKGKDQESANKIWYDFNN